MSSKQSNTGKPKKNQESSWAKQRRKYDKWWQMPGKQMEVYRNACMASIKLHSRKKVYPDWSIIGARYMENKRRDRKAEYLKRKDKSAIQKLEYRQRPEVKARAAELMRRKRKGPAFKLRSNISKRMCAVMNGEKGGQSILRWLGCSIGELKNHIESRFTKGMSWGNYGAYWHVDHILPCASFDHNDERQVRQCWHWTNLQPMEAAKNITKSDKIIKPQMSLLLNV